jgi:hypothetical protein
MRFSGVASDPIPAKFDASLLPELVPKVETALW